MNFWKTLCGLRLVVPRHERGRGMCEKKEETHAERDLVVHYGMCCCFLKKKVFFPLPWHDVPQSCGFGERECAESSGSRCTSAVVFFYPSLLGIEKDIPIWKNLRGLGERAFYLVNQLVECVK